MNEFCPLISNHENFIECRGKKCIFFKDECVFLEIHDEIENIESNTSGTELLLEEIKSKI